MSSTQAAAVPRLQPLDEALRSRGINVHYTTWLRLVRTKGLPAVKIGGRYYIDLDELDRWISDQGVAAVTQPQSNAPRTMSPTEAAAVLARRRRYSSKRRKRR